MPLLPESAITNPPVWDPDTIFQYDWTTAESSSLWTTYTNVSEQTSGGIDNSGYARLGSTATMKKTINQMGSLYIRFGMRVASVGTADRTAFQLIYGATPVVTITYDYDPDRFVLGDGAIWSRSGGWDVVEIYYGLSEAKVYYYLNGSLMDTATISSPSSVWGNAMSLEFANDAKTSTIDFCAVKIGVFSIGLPGRISPIAEQFTREYDVYLDGIGFNLFQNSLREQDLSGFAPRLGSGSPAYSDLSGFQHYQIPSFHHGMGQTDMTGAGQGDDSAYLISDGLDPTGMGMLRALNKWSGLSSLSGSHNVPQGGQIVHANVNGTPVFGVRFPTDYNFANTLNVLWAYNGTAITLNQTLGNNYGVQDLLWNGTQMFVTVGGGSRPMLATSDLVTYTTVGSTVNPPVDMGKMAMYDEFLWVSDRSTPILYRAGQVDASDLEKASADAVRVGPGNIPIQSMCPYNGRLYVGRKDGLYYVIQDQDQVYAQVVELAEESEFNYRLMVNHAGYLVYVVGERIYRSTGESKQDITPEVISSTWPYTKIRYWVDLVSSGDYLYALGFHSLSVNDKGHLLCWNGSGWHRLARQSGMFGYGGTGVEYPISLAGYNPGGIIPYNKKSAAGVRETKYLALSTVSSSNGSLQDVLLATSLELAMGTEAMTTESYQLSYYPTITTSWLHFGLPLIPKLFRMVRIDADGITASTTVKVTYSLWTGQETVTGTLGVLDQPDCNFLMFKPGTWGLKLQLVFTFNASSTVTPRIKNVIIQYLDRPNPVWGYQMTLDLSNVVRATDSITSPYTVEEQKRILRAARDKESYVRFIDDDGNESDVFVSSGPVFSKAAGVTVAQLTLMVVKRYVFNPYAGAMPNVT